MGESTHAPALKGDAHVAYPLSRSAWRKRWAASAATNTSMSRKSTRSYTRSCSTINLTCVTSYASDGKRRRCARPKASRTATPVGSAIVWDDSFEHEVVVDGEEATAPPRAVVIVHFEHPDLVKERFPRSNAALIAAAQRAPGEWNPVCDHEP